MACKQTAAYDRRLQCLLSSVSIRQKKFDPTHSSCAFCAATLHSEERAEDSEDLNQRAAQSRTDRTSQRRKVPRWLLILSATLWEPACDLFVPRFRPKTSSFRLPASLLVCTRRKIFLDGGCGFLWVTSQVK